MVPGDIKEAGADLIYGRISWLGSVWRTIRLPQVRLFRCLLEGLNLIVLGTQGRFHSLTPSKMYRPSIKTRGKITRARGWANIQ
jgi:hypothetical protein